MEALIRPTQEAPWGCPANRRTVGVVRQTLGFYGEPLGLYGEPLGLSGEPLGVSGELFGVVWRVVRRILGVVRRTLGVVRRTPGVVRRILGVVRRTLGVVRRTLGCLAGLPRALLMWFRVIKYLSGTMLGDQARRPLRGAVAGPSRSARACMVSLALDGAHSPLE